MIDMRFFLNMLDKFVINKYFIWILTTLFIITLLLSFLLKINLSNILGPFSFNEFLLNYGIQTKVGGVVSDLATHWNYIIFLKEDLNNLFNLTLGEDTNLINYPLHHLIFSQFFFIDTLDSYLITVLIISFFLPLILYFIIKNRFKNINKSNIILLSSLICIMPAFQYSAIWGNNHNIALIFFSLGILYLNSFIEINLNKNRKLIISIIFFSLACYTKQYYSFIFIFLIIYLINKISFKKFIFIFLFVLLCAIPGIYYLIHNPLLFFGMRQNITNFNSAILISSSIIFFYLVPFIIQIIINNFDEKKFTLSYFFNKRIFLISLVTSSLCIINFYYNGNVGGGIVYKISYLFFDNHFLIFPASFLGIYFLLYFSQNTISNYTLTILLLITFNTGYFIFQKYFEPMIYIILLSLFDKKKVFQSIKKSNYVIVTYFCIYYLTSSYMYFSGL